jgi:hypothetical protein
LPAVTRSAATALIAEINGAGGKAHFVELDVVNQDQWDAAVTQVKSKPVRCTC